LIFSIKELSLILFSFKNYRFSNQFILTLFGKLNWQSITNQKIIYMIKVIKFSALIIFIQFASFSLLAQSISLTKMQIVNDQMHIYYTIEDSNPNNEYLVTVLSSKNNYSAPLTNVSGDVGQEVRSGNRVAIWDIKEEIGDYVGTLSMEIRAVVFIPFVRLKEDDAKDVFKRGNNYELKWRPGNTNPVHIELFLDDQKVGGQLNHPNDGSFSTILSKDLKRGTNYKMKVSDAKHPEDFVYTNFFTVKRKIPLLLKVIPLIALGAVVSQVISGSAESAGASGSTPLPEPPSLPGN
jgi:hypothetical protein